MHERGKPVGLAATVPASSCVPLLFRPAAALRLPDYERLATLAFSKITPTTIFICSSTALSGPD